MSDNNKPDSSAVARPPGHAPGRFDFDAWSRLARSDAGAYFRARRQAIDALIDACPESAGNLRRLQLRIDSTRACAGSPLKAVRQISGLMQDRLGLLRHRLESLEQEIRRLRPRGPS